MKKSLLSILLFLISTTTTFAANGIIPGSGTQQDPYQIQDLRDLNTYLLDVKYSEDNIYTNLTSDIDATNLTFTREFYGQRIDAVFDGCGHTISNLTLNSLKSNARTTALFKYVTENGTIKNLNLENAYCDSANTYSNNIGIIASDNSGTIENCSVSAILSNSGGYDNYIGLVTGWSNGTIKNCYAAGMIISRQNFSNDFIIGGLCGISYGTILNSCAEVDINMSANIGGLCGISYGTIANCYSKGIITPGIEDWGIASSLVYLSGGQIINCYCATQNPDGWAPIAFFVRSGDGVIDNCFLDTFQKEHDIYKPLYLQLMLNGNTNYTNHPLGYQATLAGEPEWSTDGIIDQCISLDGIDDYITTGYTGSTEQFARSSSFWIKSSADTNQTIACWGENLPGKLWKIAINSNGNTLVDLSGSTITSNITVNDGQWHLITITLPAKIEPVTSDDIKVYIDSILDINATYPEPCLINTAQAYNLSFGADTSTATATDLFTGYIDDIRLYNIELTAENVESLYSLLEPQTADGYTACNTDQMQDINTYLAANWDIAPTLQPDSDSIWIIDENNYPTLRCHQGITKIHYFDTDKLLGHSQAEAAAILAEANVPVNFIYDYSPDIETNFVIHAQLNDNIYHSPSELTVLISSGPYNWSTNPGDGSIENPYIVSTPGMFLSINSDDYYELDCDLDFNYYKFDQALIFKGNIGGLSDQLPSGEFFNGVLNGRGHKLSNITITPYFDEQWQRFELYASGVFGHISEDGYVFDLEVDNINISYVEFSGGIANYCSGTISRCCVSGSISDSRWAGGICGSLTDGGTISNSYSNVSFPDPSSSCKNGGIVGINDGGSIIKCYSIGSMNSDDLGIAVLPNNYNTYSTISCFWDIDTTNTTIPYNANIPGTTYGLTTDQMQNIDNYINAGWDITPADQADAGSVWVIRPNSYPELNFPAPDSSSPRFDTTLLPGISESKAIAALARNGITAIVKYDYSLTVEAGTIIHSELEPDICTSDSLAIVVSSGPYNWSDNLGDGTLQAPYQISTPGMFLAIVDNKYYEIDRNLDFHYYSFSDSLIKSDNNFNINLNGLGHKLKDINIIDNESFTYYCGIFESIDYNSHISNLDIDNIYIDQPCDYVGAICAIHRGTINSCRVSGSISRGGYVGGICAKSSDGHISNSYSTASLKSYNSAGGIAALTLSYTDPITNCYSTGYISCDGDKSGITPDYIYEVQNCFWDTQTTQIPSDYSSENIIGLTTELMMTESTFTDAGWDFSDSDGTPAIWKIRPGYTYPLLIWESYAPGDLAGSLTVDLTDLEALLQNWLSDDASSVDLTDFAIIAYNWLN